MALKDSINEPFEKRAVINFGMRRLVDTIITIRRTTKINPHNDLVESTGYVKVNTIEEEEEYLIKSYKEFFSKYNPYISHYFRNLYHVFKFIHKSTLSTSKSIDLQLRFPITMFIIFVLCQKAINSEIKMLYTF
jgi:hypothetical protein